MFNEDARNYAYNREVKVNILQQGMQERAIGQPQVQQNKNYWNPRKNCEGKLKGFGR